MGIENPGVSFIAITLGEWVEKVPWAQMSRDQRTYWFQAASELVSAMYGAGFTIPQPVDPVAVWNLVRSHLPGVEPKGPPAGRDRFA